MNSIASSRVAWENLRSLGFASISGVYAGVGTPINNPGRVAKMHNTTDVNLFVSTNGIDNKDFIPAGGFWLYDFTANKSFEGAPLEVPAYTRFYVKQESGAPTSGNVYLTIIYASQV